MSDEKQRHHIFVLLAVGAVVLLIIFMRREAGPVIASVTDASAGDYPNANPINMGDITIGSTPPYMDYNQPRPLPAYAVRKGDTSCPCDTDPCSGVTTLGTVQNLPEETIAKAAEN